MPADKTFETACGRRQFLRAAVYSAFVEAAAQAGVLVASAEASNAPTDLSPDAALKILLDGNQRAASGKLTSLERDLAILREHTVNKQEPFAAVLSCADSRVPVEMIFDQTIGDLFVTRVAGNIVTPEIIASLEYGVAVLGVETLLVLGHSNCGAVKAAMKAEAVPGQISTLYPHLRQAVQQAGGSLEKAIEANAKIQAELLRTSSTVVRQAVEGGKLRVEAGVYDLATGKVSLS